MKNELALLRNQIADRLFKIIKNAEIENALILSSDPRGGSTWVMQVLSCIENSSVLWESMHNGKISDFDEINWTYPQLVPETAEDAKAIKYFTKLFAGKLTNPHLLQYTGYRKHFFSENLLFKFCRLGGSINWLVSNFNFETNQSI